VPKELPKSYLTEYTENLKLKAELAKKEDMIGKEIQEKVFATTTLKNELRKLKEKDVLENVTPMPNPNVLAPGMFKLDLEPLAPKVLKNRDAHIDYIKHSQEHADTLQEIEVLVYVTATCPSLSKPSEKLVAITPLNKNKKVRFAEPTTSSSNMKKQVDSHKTQDSNKPVLPSTGMTSSTNARRSQPSSNTKNNRIS
ncbi:hypothetical protein Tco_1471432, partial [Tanacetum coccineum]